MKNRELECERLPGWETPFVADPVFFLARIDSP